MTNNAPVEAVEAKRYEFRKLGAPDVFDMVRIINKIGIKEFKSCFQGDGIKDLIRGLIEAEKEDAEKEAGGDDSNIVRVGMGVAMEIASVLFEKLPTIENDLYKLLAQTSNLTVEEIKAPGNAVMFFEMVIDFLKKEEFPDFMRVVSKLF